MLRFNLNGKNHKTDFEYFENARPAQSDGNILVTKKDHVPYYNFDTVLNSKNIEPVIKQYKNVTIYNERESSKKIFNDIEKTTILFSHTTSYHHFLIDTIGAILYFKNNKSANFDIKILVDYTGWRTLEDYCEINIKSFYQEIFDYFNLGNFKDCLIGINDKSDIKFEKVSTINYPSAPLDSFYVVLKTIVESSKRLNNNNNKLYITRKGIDVANKGRSVLNDEVLQKYLSEYGYQTVYLENISFKDQVNLLSSASHVITYNGSSLVNTLFMHENTQIIEIRNSVLQQHDAYMFWSKWFNRKYHVLKCFGANSAQEIIDAIQFDDQIIL